MTSPIYFSDKVQGQSTNTRSVFPLDEITRNYTCDSGYYALTFDDGPFPGHTEDLVKVLAENHIPATFFNTGQHAQENPELVKLEQTVGVVGGHSYGHDNYTELHPSVVAADIQRTKSAISNLEFFRPPYGASNADVRREIRNAGLTETMWTVDTKDFEAPFTKEKLVSKASEVNAGGIILLHDGWPNTVRAIPAIVNDLYSRGLCPGVLRRTQSAESIMGGLSERSDVPDTLPYPFKVKAVKP